uniref:Uncharacterized protein n=1 Tax=Arundo donax TaxID=35708 RepID=A0A0A8ZUJ5_ARUDO
MSLSCIISFIRYSVLKGFFILSLLMVIGLFLRSMMGKFMLCSSP